MIVSLLVAIGQLTAALGALLVLALPVALMALPLRRRERPTYVGQHRLPDSYVIRRTT